MRRLTLKNVSTISVSLADISYGSYASNLVDFFKQLTGLKTILATCYCPTCRITSVAQSSSSIIPSDANSYKMHCTSPISWVPDYSKLREVSEKAVELLKQGLLEHQNKIPGNFLCPEIKLAWRKTFQQPMRDRIASGYIAE